ncbi:helix-turn-helix transcriptional regulator [Pseudonocardia charpentierae]|uniref:WYL domain-containing protein n=1 Tax=Pseudonocardia charpentierae TaxID=3075545 RepID=A0ABU2N5L2_9PSEU|nr:WYL domain-containing protein [Pseudonocardia sp. DSM 45834]MDT0349006.1 WYL domain-containing protein [Pseudonocardia sp. DSM 45834]
MQEASAMLKVVDALPESYRATASDAARRLLVDPETDLLSRRLVAEEVPDSIATEVRRAVFAGHKLRIHYAAVDQAPTWRTVDPIGLVTVHGHGYLLATRSGADRTYRLSRVLAAEELAEPAQRPDRVDHGTGRPHRGTGSPGPAVVAHLAPQPRRSVRDLVRRLTLRASRCRSRHRLLRHLINVEEPERFVAQIRAFVLGDDDHGRSRKSTTRA